MELGLNVLFASIQIIFAILVLMILILATLAIRSWSKGNNLISRFADENKFHSMTIVLPTWNEEILILSKLKDILIQDYPKNLLEVIIIDAGSSDSTLKIVNNWKNNYDFSSGLKFKLIEEGKRMGKSVSINRAFSEADESSEILMMSDIDCRLSPGTLKSISDNFLDPSIGAVTARQILLNRDFSALTKYESNYRDFYTKIRIAESKLDSTPIFHGECSAYRRSSIEGYKIVENSNADDSQMAVITRIAGYKAIYDENITFYEMAPPDSKSSRIQKIRRAQGLSRHFWRNKNLLFSREIGNFRRIISLEFSLHIFLPWFVILGFISGFCHIGSIIFLDYYSHEVWKFYLFEQILLLIDITVITLLLFGRLNINFPLSTTVYAFYQYMIILFISQIRILSGNSLHLWQQVSEVRESLRDYDENIKK
ncbi:MAG: hypothetical protein CMD13_00205 [Flavobacteriales bacterium]|nr:hypothetical protein [Flavobacteriales bacterium]